MKRSLAKLWSYASMRHLLTAAHMAVDKNVGGQAVIEGVMIKSPERVSTSVRLPDGRIVTKSESFVSLTKKYKILSKPILRGILSFFEMLVLGIKTLNYSAEMATGNFPGDQEYVEAQKPKRNQELPQNRV